MNEKEEMAWHLKKSDLSIKINNIFYGEELSPSQGIEILINCLTTAFAGLKFYIPEENVIEVLDASVEAMKHEFHDKMDFLKDQNSVDDVLASVLYKQVMKGKS